MTITLSDATTTLQLDPDLTWSDEHAWSPVVHATRYKMDGALSIHVSKKKAGRPITLAAGDDYGWMLGSTLRQLQVWADIPRQQLTLSLRGESYTVVFRHNDAPAVQAESVDGYSDPIDTDWYRVTLKLMVI